MFNQRWPERVALQKHADLLRDGAKERLARSARSDEPHSTENWLARLAELFQVVRRALTGKCLVQTPEAQVQEMDTTEPT